MTANDSLAALLFLPLFTACALLLLRGPLVRWLLCAVLLAPIGLLVPVTLAVSLGAPVVLVLGGWEPPLGIRLSADPLAILMLWLTAVISALAGLAALSARTGGTWFWPLWMIMVAGCNALFLSSDLFNIYVALELIVLAATPLIATAGTANALRAAMRYLLLAMLGSLAFLMGIALLYAGHGTLDLYQLASLVSDSWADRAALALITAGLLLKTAIFPLHVWLPPAHSSAPASVSAMLSALVVKASLYLVYRIWMWTGTRLDNETLFVVLGILGAGAMLYGSVAALLQKRLKLVVAYSTVAQLGYLMLLFPLAGTLAWHGANYHLLSHGLAKAAMFLAAANLVTAAANDRVDRLGGVDRADPVSAFAFGLAGVSIMGLPPSGGFLAKWTLLQAAVEQQAWVWLAVLLAGSLLAAAYVLRVLSFVFSKAEQGHDPALRASLAPRLLALTLALLAIAAGFTAAPVYSFLDRGLPPAF
jgi:multicomponent Na+:H+ antiporter subunit D